MKKHNKSLEYFGDATERGNSNLGDINLEIPTTVMYFYYKCSLSGSMRNILLSNQSMQVLVKATKLLLNKPEYFLLYACPV